MRKYKINRNRSEMSSEEINRHSDFSSFVRSYHSSHDGFWRATWSKVKRPTAVAAAMLMAIALGVMFLDEERISGDSDRVYVNYNHQVPVELASLNTDFNELIIEDGSNSMVFHLNNGTKISVPESTFITEKGEPYSDKVKLTYREYHDAFDIMTSGIPMHIDSAGVNGVLQTAGMFEIYAEDESGRPLYIADGKSLNVDLISYVNDTEYNLYYYDPQDGWTYLGISEVEETEDRVEVLADLGPGPVKPRKPQKYQDGKLVFDIKINQKNFEGFKDLKEVIWQYAGDDQSRLEKEDWVFERTWDNIEIAPAAEEGVYTIKLFKDDSMYETIVRPVLAGSSFDNAMLEYQNGVDDYEKALKAYETQQERLQLQDNVLRTFEISAFGIYNADIWYNTPNEPLQVRFYMGKDHEDTQNRIFHITGDTRTIVPYDQKYVDKFLYNGVDNNTLIAITNEKKFAVVDNEMFREAIAKTGNSETVVFDLTRNLYEVDDMSELKDIIGI